MYETVNRVQMGIAVRQKSTQIHDNVQRHQAGEGKLVVRQITLIVVEQGRILWRIVVSSKVVEEEMEQREMEEQSIHVVSEENCFDRDLLSVWHFPDERNESTHRFIYREQLVNRERVWNGVVMATETSIPNRAVHMLPVEHLFNGVTT